MKKNLEFNQNYSEDDLKLIEKIRNHEIIQKLISNEDYLEEEIELVIIEAIQMRKDGWDLYFSTNPLYKLMFDILEGIV